MYKALQVWGLGFATCTYLYIRKPFPDVRDIMAMHARGPSKPVVPGPQAIPVRAGRVSAPPEVQATPVAAENSLSVAQLERNCTASQRCLCCGAEGEMTFHQCVMPRFRNAEIIAFSCASCGYSYSKVKSSTNAPIKAFGSRTVIYVDSDAILKRDVVLSDTATLAIPALGFEVQAGNGKYTTVEGLLASLGRELRAIKFAADETEEADKPAAAAGAQGQGGGQGAQGAPERLAQLVQDVAQRPFTIAIDDPLSESWVDGQAGDEEEAVVPDADGAAAAAGGGAATAPAPPPAAPAVAASRGGRAIVAVVGGAHVTRYPRTAEQDADLGLTPGADPSSAGAGSGAAAEDNEKAEGKGKGKGKAEVRARAKAKAKDAPAPEKKVEVRETLDQRLERLERIQVRQVAPALAHDEGVSRVETK
jgi:C4-type Zn-finger protein